MDWPLYTWKYEGKYGMSLCRTCRPDHQKYRCTVRKQIIFSTRLPKYRLVHQNHKYPACRHLIFPISNSKNRLVHQNCTCPAWRHLKVCLNFPNYRPFHWSELLMSHFSWTHFIFPSRLLKYRPVHLNCTYPAWRHHWHRDSWVCQRLSYVLKLFVCCLYVILTLFNHYFMFILACGNFIAYLPALFCYIVFRFFILLFNTLNYIYLISMSISFPLHSIT